MATEARSGLWQKAISVALACTLAFSMVPVAFAEPAHADENVGGNEVITYVSIGDSMTNGYGLDGYDGRSGLMNYGMDTYGNEFAAWLAGYEGEIADDQVIFTGSKGTVDHRQLAMSGLRAEDLHWLLELDYTNEALVKAGVDSFQDEPACSNPECDHSNRGWGGCQRYAWFNDLGFTAGDHRTWDEMTDPDYRLTEGIAKMVSVYGYNNEEWGFNSDYDTQDWVNQAIEGLKTNDEWPDGANTWGGTEGRHKYLQVGAEFYQESIAEADIVSLSLGNTNFGTFMFDYMQDIFKNPNYDKFNQRFKMDELYEYVMDLDPQIEAEIRSLVDQVDGLVAQYFDTELVGETGLKNITFIIKYCVLSYLVNYVGAVERIVELNPDVELIQIALINAYSTESGVSVTEGTDFAGLIDMLYQPLNAFIAALPTVMQGIDDQKYADATFYYADCGYMQTLSEVFGDNFYTVNGEAIEYPGIALTDDIEPADSLIRQRFLGWIAGFDRTSRTYFTRGANPSYGEIWKHVLDELYVNDSQEGDFFGVYDLMYVTNGDIADYVRKTNAEIEAMLTGEDKSDRDWAFSCSLYLAFEDAIIRAGQGSLTVEAFGQLKGIGVSTFESALNLFCEKVGIESMSSTLPTDIDIMSVFQSLSDALMEDPVTSSMLALSSRMQVGTGIGGHPSEGGHAAMFEAVKNAYETGYTSEKQTFSNAIALIVKVLETSNPELLAQLEQVAEYLGSDEFSSIVDEIKALYQRFDESIPDEQKAEILEKLYAFLTKVQDLAYGTTDHAYVIDEGSYYTSLGDSSMTGYGLENYVPGQFNGEGQMCGEAPVLLAQKLFGDEWESHFTQLAKGGIRAADMLYFIDLEAETDEFFNEYTMDSTSRTREQWNALYLEGINKADLITIGIGGGDVTGFVSQQISRLEDGKEPFPMHWDELGLAAEEIAELHEAVSGIEETLNGFLPEVSGVPAATLTHVVAESFVYGYVNYFKNCTLLFDKIHEINPEAHLVIVGYFNPVDGMTLPVSYKGETYEIPVGAGTGVLLETSNLYCLGYALANVENTTFVNIPDAECFLDVEIANGEVADEFATYLAAMFDATYKTHATQDGHEYIAQRIFDALQEDAAWKEIAGQIEDIELEDIRDAAQSLYAQLLDYLEQVKAAAVEQVKVALNELRAQAEETIQAIIDEIESKIYDLTVEAEKALYAALEECQAQVEQAIADIIDMILKGEFDQDLLDEANATIESALDELLAKIAEVDPELAKAIEDEIDAFKSDFDALSAAVEAYFVEAVHNTTHGDYAITAESQVVALGDASLIGEDSYAALLVDHIKSLAEAKNLTFDENAQFVNLAEEGLLVEDILAKLEAGTWNSQLAAADLVIVGMGGENLTSFINTQLEKIVDAYIDVHFAGKDYQHTHQNWATYLGEENVEYVERILAKVEQELNASVDDADIAAMLTDIVEAYAYGYAGFALHYAEVLDNVRAQSPEAEIIVVGLNNIFEGLVLEFDGFKFNIGEYADYVTKAAGLQYLAYGILAEDEQLTYVSAPDAGSDASALVEEAISTALNEGLLSAIGLFAQLLEDVQCWMPNAEGDAYILERILGAVTFTVEGGTESNDITQAEVVCPESVVYDAEYQTPVEQVLFEGEPLVEGVDYEVEYVDNLEVGIGYAAVRGIGSYEGEIPVFFQIEHLATIDSFPDFANEWYLSETEGGAFEGVPTLYMDYALATGLFSGYKGGSMDGLFGTWKSITRAEVATVIYRMANPDSVDTINPDAYATENTTGLSDVETGVFYTAAVNWCVENGIITGYLEGSDAGKFKPHKAVSRQELATMIERYCVDVCGVEASYANLDSFSDCGKIQTWAVDGMGFCADAGIITGYSGTDEIGPLNKAFRCEAAKVFSVVDRNVLS